MRTSVVIVGAGPGGLAMSHYLTGTGLDHVLLERGELAHAWRTERWDSLRLLTPNWMASLPGAPYDGNDPDGYMNAAEIVATLEAYRRFMDPPLRTGVEVESACYAGSGFEVRTNEGTWHCDAVVAATGGSSEPRVPDFASEVPRGVQQFTSLSYRSPAQIDGRGNVLVVGASASGVQIADELRRAGHDVTVAVGEHVRLPRSYRGRDIYWWLDRIGQLDEGWNEVEDLQRARRHASVQVVGSDEQREVDLRRCRVGGSNSWGASWPFAAGTPCVPAGWTSGGQRRSQTSQTATPHRPMGESARLGRSHRPASRAESDHRHSGADPARPGRTYGGDLGYRIPPQIQLAGPLGVRPPRTRGARRRRGPAARALPPRPPLLATAPIEPARRIGCRRGRTLPASDRLLGGHRPAG